MLKIILYAAMEKSYASRPIALSCLQDMNCIWLLDGEAPPNHIAISRFRSDELSVCAEELLYELIHKLRGLGEIRFEHLFADGTKIEANANKYSFVWKKGTTKYESRVDKKLGIDIAEMGAKHGVLAQSARELLARLNSKKICLWKFWW